MKKQVAYIFVLLLFLTFLTLSCESCESGPYSVTLASWNVQNLFDAEDNGNEYKEYTKKGGWTEEAYKTRIRTAAQIFNSDRFKAADIIVLNEVENDNVIQDLLKMHTLAKRGIRFYASAKNQEDAIQTSVLSNLEIKRARIHATAEGLRPVLEVCLDTEFGNLYVLAVHAKSKIGDEAETAAARLIQARTLAEISEDILKNDRYAAVIIAGDLNEEYSENNMMGFSNNTPLPVSAEKNSESWYCFWTDTNTFQNPSGSYFYNNIWLKYDNILAKCNQSLFTIEDAGVMFTPLLKNAEEQPDKWNRQTLSGVSDHLPVFITLS